MKSLRRWQPERVRVSHYITTITCEKIVPNNGKYSLHKNKQSLKITKILHHLQRCLKVCYLTFCYPKVKFLFLLHTLIDDVRILVIFGDILIH